MSKFYSDKSDDWYFGDFWKAERNELSKINAKLITLDEANRLPISTLFSKNMGEAMPKPDIDNAFKYFAFPYELDDDNFPVMELNGLINQYIEGKKYFASTNKEQACVIEHERFSDDLFWICASGHLNTPFVVFNEKCECFVILDYDLPIQIVCYKDGLFSQEYIDKWNKYLFNHWPKVRSMYTSYTNLQNLIDRYYPNINGVIEGKI